MKWLGTKPSKHEMCTKLNKLNKETLLMYPENVLCHPLHFIPFPLSTPRHGLVDRTRGSYVPWTGIDRDWLTAERHDMCTKQHVVCLFFLAEGYIKQCTIAITSVKQQCIDR